MTMREHLSGDGAEARSETDHARSPSVPTSPTVLVGIPAYNEADVIGVVVRDALAVADSVVVVDDGSDDDTARHARDAGATVVEHSCNRGYGAAIVTILQEAVHRSPDHLVVVDGDGQHDPADVPRLVEHQRQSGAGVVIGSRFVAGGSMDAPRYRRLGLHVVNWLVNLSLGRLSPGSWIADTQSGFRAYDPRAVRTLATKSQIGASMGASVDILHAVATDELVVEEVPVEIRYDVPAASTEHPLSHGVSLVSNVLRHTFRTR
ncbi:glycosyltransferase family 2 protein [Salinigranum salinum]|uniref:glycosyltransferase family 2 protein n=1 Tax=Salinigranum salinum TaxID=1364937 RepID=UPI0012604932|nr:glycosyltransferase family 2 protein [Salinigranum salinum]